MRTRLIAGCALAAIAIAGDAGALNHAARRAFPGASLGRHPARHLANHHTARHFGRPKPVIAPPQ